MYSLLRKCKAENGRPSYVPSTSASVAEMKKNKKDWGLKDLKKNSSRKIQLNFQFI